MTIIEKNPPPHFILTGFEIPVHTTVYFVSQKWKSGDIGEIVEDDFHLEWILRNNLHCPMLA